MPTCTIHALGDLQMTRSGGAQLSGLTRGDGSHLVGVTVTLNSNAWEAIDVFDSESEYQASDNSQPLDGAQTFDGTSHADSRRVEAEHQLKVQDSDGNTWSLIGCDINEPGVTSHATVEGLEAWFDEAPAPNPVWAQANPCGSEDCLPALRARAKWDRCLAGERPVPAFGAVHRD